MTDIINVRDDEWVSRSSDNDDYIVKDNKNGLLSGIVAIINCFLSDLNYHLSSTLYTRDLWYCINNKFCQQLILQWNEDYGGLPNLEEGLKLETMLKFGREMLLVDFRTLNPIEANLTLT